MDNRIFSDTYIHSAHTAASLAGDKQAKKKKNAKKTSRKNFLSMFTEQKEQSAASTAIDIPPEIRDGGDARITEYLLDEVHTRGDAIKTIQTQENIVAYRKAVQALMRFIVDRAYTTTQQTTRELNPLKRKTMTQIKIIDQKLDKLAADTLYTQGEQLKILTQIEEIYGLLVDLLT